MKLELDDPVLTFLWRIIGSCEYMPDEQSFDAQQSMVPVTPGIRIQNTSLLSMSWLSQATQFVVVGRFYST